VKEVDARTTHSFLLSTSTITTCIVDSFVVSICLGKPVVV